MNYNNNNYQQQQYQPRDVHAQGSDRALGWDDEITQESEFIIAEPGIYPFTIKGFTRARFAGSPKMSPCPEAILDVEIIDKATGKPVIIKESLKLHSKAEWKLSEFFVSIGQKRKGEPLKMNWNTVTGARGMLELNHRTYNGNTYNNIKKFLPPEEQTQTAWNSGQF